jgi:predicted enzyme related to lactoylglutathione lyase
MADPTVRGRFVWHELMTTDTKSAAGFFTKVIGWKTQGWDQDPSYTMFTSGGRPTAGLMTLPADAKAMGAPPNWLTYVGTPDVDATAQQAKSLGGTVLREPSDIPKIGRWALIQDPQGAVFAAFTPAPSDTSAAPPSDFSWHELATTDQRAALAFYQSLFGWEATSSMDMGPGMGTYQMFGWGKQAAGGIFTKPAQMPGPPSWLPYIKVSDSKKTAASVKKQGGKVINGPMEVPGGDWIAQGMDLQGAVFAVHSAKSAASQPTAAAKPAKAKRAAKRAKKTAKPRAAAKSKSRGAKKSKGKAKSARKAKTRSSSRKGRRR